MDFIVGMIPLIKRVRNFFVNNGWSIFLAWSLWLTLEYFILGRFSYVEMFDVGDGTIPMRLALIKGFLEDGFNLWFPYAVSGTDRLAVTFLNVFQIESLFFLAFPGWLAYAIVTFLQRFLAGYFTYRLCKDYLKLDELPSTVAGLAYSLVPFHFQTQFAGEAGLPFILWSLERIGEKKNLGRYLLSFLLGLFALFSSSFPISVPFILPVALAWLVLVRRKYSLHFLVPFVIFSVILVVGKTPIIWALLVNAPLSWRVDYQDVIAYHGAWTVATNGVLNFVKDNIVYIIIGILGLYWSRFKERSLLKVMVLLAFCGLASYFLPLALYFASYIGVFSGFNFSRFRFLAPFFAVVALAYGLHLVNPNWVLPKYGFHNGNKYLVKTILCVGVIILLVVNSLGMKYEHGLRWGAGSSYAVNYQNPDLQRLATNIDSAPFRVGTVGISRYSYEYHQPAFANAYGLETVDGFVVLYPKRYRDFWVKVLQPLLLKDEDIYSYFAFGPGGLHVNLYSPMSGFGPGPVPFSEYYNLNLLSLANTKYFISELPISNEHLTLLPSPITDRGKIPREISLENIIGGIEYNINDRRLYIYQNELYFPRFFLSGKTIVFEDSGQLLEALAEADVNSLRNNVFIEERSVPKIDLERLGFSQGELVIEKYSPDQIILSVNLDKPGILVISNSYSPYWIAKVNGVTKDIFPAYHTFMGVFLEEGESLVELEYSPPYRTILLK